MLIPRLIFAALLLAVAAYSFVKYGICAKEHRKHWCMCRVVQGGIAGFGAVVTVGALVGAS